MRLRVIIASSLLMSGNCFAASENKPDDWVHKFSIANQLTKVGDNWINFHHEQLERRHREEMAMRADELAERSRWRKEQIAMRKAELAFKKEKHDDMILFRYGAPEEGEQGSNNG